MSRLTMMVTLLLCLLLAGCGSSSGTAQDAAPLLADIGVTKKQLIVKNGDPTVWRQVTITINGSYSYTVEELPRGSSSLPLSRFVSSSGKVFEPGLLHLRRIDIHAADNGSGQPGTFQW